METLDDKRARLAKLEAALAESGGRGVDLAEEIDRLRLDIGRETGEGPFGCRTCGSDQLVAWYPTYERQGVEILSYDGDSFEIDYDGSTDTADDSGENEEYRCLNCDDCDDTLEELCGLPRPAAARPVYKAEVFDSEGTLAIQFENGQDIAHLRWVDGSTATDEFAEPDWRALTDAERQQITDAIAAAVQEITRGRVAS